MDEPAELHLLVPREDGAAVLAVHGSGLLPSTAFTAPPKRPIVQSVVPLAGSIVGRRLPVLETYLPWEGRADGEPLAVLAVTEPPPASWQPSGGLDWRPNDGVGPSLPGHLAARAATMLGELRRAEHPPALRPRWARPGWYARASAWMTARLSEIGRPPTGPIEQTHVRGISAVLRAPTAAGAAYLKAVFPPFHHEPVLSRMLADRVSRQVPGVLAVEADEGWLLMDDLGPDDTPTAGIPARSAAAIRTLVTIQRAFTGAGDDLTSLGCPVRRLPDLPGDLSRALDRVARLESVAPVTIDPRRVAWLERAVQAVEDLGHAETLVHGDFHPDNVVARDGGVVVFDWSDAALSHPLVDVATWVQWLDGPPGQAAAWDAWLSAWADVCDPDRARPLFGDVVGVGAAYQVVSYVGILEALEPATRYTMAGGLTTYLARLDAAVAGS